MLMKNIDITKLSKNSIYFVISMRLREKKSQDRPKDGINIDKETKERSRKS